VKIALIVHDFDPGFGHGRYAVELARRVAEHHELHVYANSFAVASTGDMTFHHVRAWRRTALISVLTFLIECEVLLRRQRYDVVHAQGVTCWGADIITAHICNAARLHCLSQRDVRARLFSRIIAPVEARFYRQPRARSLIAVSNRLGREIANHYGWVRDVSVVYHGTDGIHFRPPRDDVERRRARVRYGLDEPAWVWLFVGEATKGLQHVIAQLRHFPDATLLVMSRSDTATARNLADGLGVTGQVMFHGPIDDLTDVYRAADVFVYPSEYDAFGLVVAEAMASALPVVVGSEIGAAEWITHGQNGLLCNPADPASLHQQLHSIHADPARAARLGRAARRTVEEHSWDSCAAATLGIYERVVGTRI
jgi:UDP-glucose:(heptosyl)LPS alpha-1,3-glucosyltransferase